MSVVNSRLLMALFILGFALFLLLLTFTMWAGSSAILSPAFFGAMFLSLFTFVRSACFYIAFFTIALLSNKLFESNALFLSIITSLLLFSGILFSSFPDFFRISPAAILFCGSIFIGAGSAFSFMIWLQIASRLSLQTAGLAIIAATFLSGPLFFIVMALPSSVTSLTVIGVVAPLSFLFLVFCTAKCFSVKDRSTPNLTLRKSFREILAPLWKSLVSICIIGFVSGVLRMTTISDESTGRAVNDVSMLAMSLAALVLIVFWNKYWDKFELTAVYQIAFPVVSTGFILLPFLGYVYRYFFTGLSFLTFSVVSMLMLLSCIKASGGSSKQLRFVFGIFAGCIYFSIGAGSAVGTLAANATDFGFTQLLVLTMVCIYLLGIAFFAIRDRQRKQPQASNSELVFMETNRNAISRQCEKLAAVYSLSKREQEIAEHLARGRDVPYISNTLFISKNTVRTHSKKLYRKLAIHSRQELLDKLEEVLLDKTQDPVDTTEKSARR